MARKLNLPLTLHQSSLTGILLHSYDTKRFIYWNDIKCCFGTDTIVAFSMRATSICKTVKCNIQRWRFVGSAITWLVCPKIKFGRGNKYEDDTGPGDEAG
jgi:hypothetical protein